MYSVFKSGFRVENNKQLNVFASEVIKISEQYIRFLIYRGKISSLGDLSAFDAAVDITAEMFRRENGVLISFLSYFEKLDVKPSSEEDYINSLRQFVFSVTMKNLTHIYKLTDPVTNKLLRNLKFACKEENYLATEIFSNKYLHRKPVNFESSECMEKDVLLRLILSKNGFKHPSAKEFINYVFDVIESQKEYLHAMPLNDILSIYKEIISLEARAQFVYPECDAEFDIHFKLLLEEIKKGFLLKLNKYFNKKGFSEKERTCVYNIIDEVINCYTNGIHRDSIKELAKRHNGDNVSDSFCYKIEYLIGLLNSDIISLLQKEDKINVRQLNK